MRRTIYQENLSRSHFVAGSDQVGKIEKNRQLVPYKWYDASAWFSTLNPSGSIREPRPHSILSSPLPYWFKKPAFFPSFILQKLWKIHSCRRWFEVMWQIFFYSETHIEETLMYQINTPAWKVNTKIKKRRTKKCEQSTKETKQYISIPNN